jgi:predicted DNA binding CopG/RHH family protein
LAKHNFLAQSINNVDTPMWAHNNFRDPKNQKITSVQQSELSWKASYTYTKKRKISMRIYAGNVWGIKHRSSADKTGENIDGISPLSLSLTGTPGTRDYFNDEIFLNRSGDASNSQTWSQQRGNNQGGFRNLSGTGLNSKQLVTGNFYIPFPIGPSFLGVFGDIGYFTAFNPTTGANNVSLAKGQLAWSSGVGIKFSDMFGLYLPIVQSQNLSDNSPSTWNQRIRINASFSFRLEPLSKAAL